MLDKKNNCLKIAVVGEQCAGKTTLAGILGEEYVSPDVFMVKLAKPLYGMLAALGKPKERRYMQESGDLAKKHFGERVFLDIFEKNVEGYEEEARLHQWSGGGGGSGAVSLLLCDDIRRRYEVGSAMKMGFMIVYVEADPLLRRERASAQGLEFREDHNSESEVASLQQYAGYSLQNNGTEEEFQQEIAKMVCSMNLGKLFPAF